MEIDSRTTFGVIGDVDARSTMGVIFTIRMIGIRFGDKLSVISKTLNRNIKSGTEDRKVTLW